MRAYWVLRKKNLQKIFIESSVVDIDDSGQHQQPQNNHPLQETKIRQPKTSTDRLIVRNNTDNMEADQKVLEHMEKSNGTFSCKICGKSSGHRAHMRNHIETHLEGLSFNCQHCGKVYKSRNYLSQHIHYQHKQSN